MICGSGFILKCPWEERFRDNFQMHMRLVFIKAYLQIYALFARDFIDI